MLQKIIEIVLEILSSSSSSTSSARAESTTKQRRLFVDLTAVAAISIFILFGCFGRTVLAGKSISQLPILAVGDAYYNNDFRLALPRPRFDPSLYQFHIPFQIYAARELREGRIPLWNPDFGCGFPTFAELQYCTFSPFRAIFGAANPYLYNLGIVLKVLTAALGTFSLARLLSVSAGASAFAAIAYSLSPFILRELELPNEVEFFPLVACAFLVFANRNTLWSRFLLGLSASLTIYCMHPEFAFLSVLFAVVYLGLAKTIAENATSTQRTNIVFLPFKQWLQNLVCGGLIGLCLAAPLLLPFLELLSISHSYKFGDFFVQKAPLQTLLLGLITPLCKGGSPFTGVVSLALALFAAGTSARRLMPFILVMAGLILWVSAPGPLAQVEAMRPFSYIAPRYFLAPMLLVLSLLSALGVDQVKGLIRQKDWLRLLPLALIAVVLAAFPYILQGLPPTALPGFDGTLPPPALVKPEFSKGALALLLMLSAALVCLAGGRNIYLSSALPYLLLLANLLSLDSACRLALPPSITFNFSSSPVLEEIKASGERMTACGRYFFYANVSMVYGLRDFRISGPIYPAWTAAFSKGDLAESTPDWKPKLPDPFLDTASIKYIISRWPVRCTDEDRLKFKPAGAWYGSPQAVSEQASLIGVDYCLTADNELFTKISWQQRQPAARYLAAQIDIVTADGRTLRQSERLPLSPPREGSKIIQELSVKLPDAKEKFPLYAVLRICSLMNESYLPINQLGFPMRAHGIELINLSQVERNPPVPNSHLQFLKEDSKQILLYRNNQAMPQAYLTGNIVNAGSLQEAKALLHMKGFDPHRQTIIEAKIEAKKDGAAQESKQAFTIPCRLERKNSSSLMIRADAPADCFLILTDTYYRGWRAFIDDKPADIMRANVAFRAVRVPKGQHTIRFEFLPVSLITGLAVAILAIIIVALADWRSPRKTQFPSVASHSPHNQS